MISNSMDKLEEVEDYEIQIRAIDKRLKSLIKHQEELISNLRTKKHMCCKKHCKKEHYNMFNNKDCPMVHCGKDCKGHEYCAFIFEDLTKTI